MGETDGATSVAMSSRFGKFLVQEPLGMDGMASVYRAVDACHADPDARADRFVHPSVAGADAAATAAWPVACFTRGQR